MLPKANHKNQGAEGDLKKDLEREICVFNLGGDEILI